MTLISSVSLAWGQINMNIRIVHLKTKVSGSWRTKTIMAMMAMRMTMIIMRMLTAYTQNTYGTDTS